MSQSVLLRPVRQATQLAVASLFVACATTHTPSGFAASDSSLASAVPARDATLAELPTVTPPRRDEMAMLHPPTMVSFSAAVGDRAFEINSGDPDNVPPVADGETTGTLLRLEAEHFLRNQFGLFVTLDYGLADGIYEESSVGPFPDSELNSLDWCIGAAFRATLDDDFRMPVRLGVFSYNSEFSFTSASATDRSSWGLRLGAEPEFIIMQQISESGSRKELTAFADVYAGAGRSKTEDPTPPVTNESGYAFNFGWEVGLRFNVARVLLALSFLGKKYHYDATESYNQGVYFGSDDDFTGFNFTIGIRL